jgi:hypothetical protein
MENIEDFRGVIQMAIEDALREDPQAEADSITGDIIKSVRIAQRLAGGGSPRLVVNKTRSVGPSASLIDMSSGAKPTPKPRALVLPETEGAILIGEAPPVAGIEQNGPQAPQEFWEAAGLARHLENILPSEFSVNIPGHGPVLMGRQIQAPRSNMVINGRDVPIHSPFVNVLYTQSGQAEGPRVTVMITTQHPDKDAILKEIEDGALKLYSADRRQPVFSPPPAPKPPQIGNFGMDRGQAETPRWGR